MKFYMMVMLIFLALTANFSHAQNPQDMIDFANKLIACEVYNQPFSHPITGESLERKIKGMTNDRCLYIEEMPNGGRMECRFSVQERQAVANYHKDLAKAKTFGTKATITAESRRKITYVIDGKEVANPLQECMANKSCVITGY